MNGAGNALGLGFELHPVPQVHHHDILPPVELLLEVGGGDSCDP